MNCKPTDDMDGYTPNIKTIYVDMDGVLVDLYSPLSIYLEEDYEVVRSRMRRLQCTNKYQSYVMPLLHNISATDIFERVECTENFTSLIRALLLAESKGIEIKILSSTMKDNIHSDNLKSCKQKWLSNYGISWEAIFVQGRHGKSVYANESSLLIDDTFSNVSEWKDKEGYGIYHTSHTNTIKYLYDLELI